MIFLDAEEHIEESIRSVVEQVYVDWELILVDDGSRDRSTTIAREWAARDQRIRYVEHPGHVNRGMSASRNLGVDVACGELVTFLDSDDLWLPSTLAHRVRVLRHHPEAAALIGGTWRWYSWEPEPTGVDHVMALPPSVPIARTVEPPAGFVAVYGDVDCWFVPATCSIVVRRAALLGVDGLDETFTGLYEDQVLYAKVLLHLAVVVDDRGLALYRQHDRSATATAVGDGSWRRSGRSATRDRFLDWLDAYTSGGDELVRAIVLANGREQIDAVGHGDEPGVDPPPPTASWARTRLRRIAGALVGPHRDRSWLEHHWTVAHLGGWRGATAATAWRVVAVRWRRSAWERSIADIVGHGPDRGADAPVDVCFAPMSPAARWIPRRHLRRLGRAASCSRVVTTIVPVRPQRHRIGGLRDAATAERVARQCFPGRSVIVEPFGNERVRRMVTGGGRLRDLAPLDLVRHDAAAPVLVAITAEADHQVMR